MGPVPEPTPKVLYKVSLFDAYFLREINIVLGVEGSAVSVVLTSGDGKIIGASFWHGKSPATR